MCWTIVWFYLAWLFFNCFRLASTSSRIIITSPSHAAIWIIRLTNNQIHKSTGNIENYYDLKINLHKMSANIETIIANLVEGCFRIVHYRTKLSGMHLRHEFSKMENYTFLTASIFTMQMVIWAEITCLRILKRISKYSNALLRHRLSGKGEREREIVDVD